MPGGFRSFQQLLLSVKKLAKRVNVTQILVVLSKTSDIGWKDVHLEVCLNVRKRSTNSVGIKASSVTPTYVRCLVSRKKKTCVTSPCFVRLLADDVKGSSTYYVRIYPGCIFFTRNLFSHFTLKFRPRRYDYRIDNHFFFDIWQCLQI